MLSGIVLPKSAKLVQMTQTNRDVLNMLVIKQFGLTFWAILYRMAVDIAN